MKNYKVHQKPTDPQLIKIALAYYEVQIFLTVFTTDYHLSPS